MSNSKPILYFKGHRVTGQSHGSQFSSDSISNWQYSHLAPLSLSFLSERKRKKEGRKGKEKEQERNKEKKLEKKKKNIKQALSALGHSRREPDLQS